LTETHHGSRELLALAAVLAFASPAFEAQCAEPIPKIGFLGMDSAMQAQRVSAFQNGLASLGYVDGKNIVIDYRWAEGKFDRLPQLAAELVADKVSIIVTAAPPAVRPAKQATATIPIVMTIHNPVGQGLVASLARPGGNITGIAFQDAELSTKRLSYLHDAVPGLVRVAILWNAQGGGPDTVEAVESAARTLGLQTRAFEVHDAAEFPTAIKAAKSWGADGLIQLASPFFTLNRKSLIAELSANRMPATCELREYVVDGCLMTYSADLNAMFRQMASFVDRILKGAKPAELPIEQPREFQFVINKKTAEMLGLKIPKALEIQMTEPLL
jgi:putative ABC transport system substrate-binding protein